MLALSVACTAAGQEVERPPAAAAPALEVATLTVHISTPERARVEADYLLTGSGTGELMFTWFPGQTLSELNVQVNGERHPVVPPGELRSAIWRLPLRLSEAGPHRLHVDYVVRVSETFRHRFPLPVPTAAAAAAARPVEIRVLLPTNTFFDGDSFPRLAVGPSDSGGEILRAQLVAVPSFVHVSFSTQPAGMLSFSARLELLAAGALALLPIAWVVLRRWRRGLSK